MLLKKTPITYNGSLIRKFLRVHYSKLNLISAGKFNFSCGYFK